MWKKQAGIIFSTLILVGTLTGCFGKQEERTEPNLEPLETSNIIAPSVQVQEKYYRGLHPFVTSQTRGSLESRLGAYRLDMGRLELGLMEIAQQFVPIENHLFREGQLITENELKQWLGKAGEANPNALNPVDVADPILLHILEHNYWDMKGESLEAVVIGLSLASTYKSTPLEGQSAEKITMRYTPDELRNYGSVMGSKLAEKIRAKVNDVPIIIALYQLEEANSHVPGSFLSVGYVQKDQNYVSDWRALNEVYFILPSNALTRFDRERSTSYARNFSLYKEEVQEFFPNFVGLIGLGRFVDERLTELTFTATTEFASKTEVIQLTQFLGAKAIEHFPKEIPIHIYVQAINQPQAIFIRPASGEPFMHIYR